MKKFYKILLIAVIITAMVMGFSTKSFADSPTFSTHYTETLCDFPVVDVSESYSIYANFISGEWKVYKDDFCSIIVQGGSYGPWLALSDATKYYEYGVEKMNTGYDRDDYQVWLDPSWVLLWANTKNFELDLAANNSVGEAYGSARGTYAGNYFWISPDVLIPM